MKLARFVCALLLITMTGPALAETWRVDLLVFRYLRAVNEVGQMPFVPSTKDAIELDDTATLSAAGITVLPESEYGLDDQWLLLRRSPQFRPLIKLAWTQNDPPATGGPRLRVTSGKELKVRMEDGFGERQFNEIDGSVALKLGRFLHLDADLAYTVIQEDEAQTWPLRESRRMRSEELHHLDSPKLGIIAIVQKWVP